MDDVTSDETLVRALLAEQHPDLAGRELRIVDGGWSNRMWRLGDDLAVRLPRTDRDAALLETEHRWVPELAARLPLPVSTPVRSGAPSARFDRRWLVVTWVAGEPADASPAVRADESAEALAGFLTALHIAAPADAPEHDGRGAPLADQHAAFERCLGSGTTDRPVPAMRRVWEDALEAKPWQGPPLWLHGDLHPANVVTADGALAGVIDFGSLFAGDPAFDLAAAWLLLPDPQACLERYGADADTIRRSRGAAMLKALVLLGIARAGEQGLPGGKPSWRAPAEAAIDRLIG